MKRVLQTYDTIDFKKDEKPKHIEHNAHRSHSIAIGTEPANELTIPHTMARSVSGQSFSSDIQVLNNSIK